MSATVKLDNAWRHRWVKALVCLALTGTAHFILWPVVCVVALAIGCMLVSRLRG